MATIVSTRGNISVLEVEKGEQLFVRHIVGESAHSCATLFEMDNGNEAVCFTQDALVVVEEYVDGKKCKHLRFTRLQRSDAKGDLHSKIMKWPRLRVALHNAGISPVNVPGGLDYAVAYEDELIVANYSMSGSSGWIINRKDIGRILDSLPPLEDTGERGWLWIDSVGWMNTPDECNIRVVDHDPTNDPAPEYYDRARGCTMSSNRQVYLVEYDKGSRLVKKILHQNSGEEVKSVGYKTEPVSRYIQVGKRLPGDVA